MNEGWEPVFGLLAGSFAILFGVLIRLGHLRRGVLVWYHNQSIPQSARNALFAAIPIGLFLLLGAGGMVLFDVGGPWEVAALGMYGLALVSLVAGLAIQLHPPDWVKPTWLRCEEENR